MEKKKILFFDDEEATSASLVRNLNRNYGHQITGVSDLSLFFNLLEEEIFSLIILDVMVPIPPNFENLGFTQLEQEDYKQNFGLNAGLSIAHKVWRNRNYTNVPIIFLTSKQHFKLPMRDNVSLVLKPTLASSLSQEIEKMLKK